MVRRTVWTMKSATAKRRGLMCLRQFLRHERLSVAVALAELQHHTAKRGQRRARAGRVEREEKYEPRPQNPPLPQTASTEYFALDDDEEMLAAGGRPPAHVSRCRRRKMRGDRAVHGGCRRRHS